MLDAVTEQRFWDKVDKSAGPEACWPWQAARTGGGYGRFYHHNTYTPAHRMAWQITHNSSFPDGMLGCHSCDNPPCVNPSHIWPGTKADNANDMIKKHRGKQSVGYQNSIKTHCTRGHEYTEENTYRSRKGRECRTCHRTVYDAAYRAKRRASRGQVC